MMQELIDRVGVLNFVQIVVECLNEVFISLILLMLLIGIQSYKGKPYFVKTRISLSKHFVVFYITILLYGIFEILIHLFNGDTTLLGRTALQVSLFCSYLIGGFHNTFLLQAFKKYLAERMNMPALKKAIMFFQVLQMFLALVVLFSPFKNIFYQINDKNEFAYLWGNFLWHGIALGTFLFIGLVILFNWKEMNPASRMIIIVIDVFPLISCIGSFFSSASNITSSVTALIVFILYEQNKTQFIIKNMYELEKAKVLLAESRLSLEESKNQTLMAQIQPHFINNSLMALRARCIQYPEIYDSITHFSLYLRSHFEALGDTKTISFEQEMTNIEAYLALEQQNYKERLVVEYEIECDDFSVPALSVQPLVENAVRHGIGTYEKGGTVQINTYRKGRKIIIEVIDDGSGKNNITPQQTRRKGIGVENVRARLQSMSNENLEIISRENGTTARITIEETD